MSLSAETVAKMKELEQIIEQEIGYKNNLIIMRLEKHTSQDVMNAIANITCQYYNVTWPDILGKSRCTQFKNPRHVIMYILHLYGVGPSKVGEFMNRDHTTAIHARERMLGFKSIGAEQQLFHDIEQIITIFENQRQEAA